MATIDKCEIAPRTSGVETPQRERPRVLLADDHDFFLSRVMSVLKLDFDVVGTVNDGGALVCEAQRLHPDLIVLDIAMPVLNGIEAAHEIHSAYPAIKLVFLTLHPDPQFVRACFAEGGLGYVIKSRLERDLIPAINEALLGRSFISPSVGGALL
ncbi:response regulator transcription factor [Acidobacterium sp. S8]|uniref:response regulator n=1 Tax=Acidobacterium sp. S8 TaxID=1641854 RepID=UPI00131CECD0|nr:response regulator transcription factor [Acidobacterium sp. S8]